MKKTIRTERLKRVANGLIAVIPAALIAASLIAPGKVVSSGANVACIVTAGESQNAVSEIEAIESCLNRTVKRDRLIVSRADEVAIEGSSVMVEKRSELEAEENYRRVPAAVAKRTEPEAKLMAVPHPGRSQYERSGGGLAGATGGSGSALPERTLEGAMPAYRSGAGALKRTLRESAHEAVAYHSIRNGYIPDGGSIPFTHQDPRTHFARTDQRNNSKPSQNAEEPAKATRTIHQTSYRTHTASATDRSRKPVRSNPERERNHKITGRAKAAAEINIHQRRMRGAELTAVRTAEAA